MEKFKNLFNHIGVIALCLIAICSGTALGYSICVAGILQGMLFVTFCLLILIAIMSFVMLGDPCLSQEVSNRIRPCASVAVCFLLPIFFGIGIFQFSVEPPTIIDPNPDMQLELQQCKASIENATKALRQ